MDRDSNHKGSLSGCPCDWSLSEILFLTSDTGGYGELDRHGLHGVVGSGDGEVYVEFSGWRQTWRAGAAGAGAATTASADHHGTAK